MLEFGIEIQQDYNTTENRKEDKIDVDERLRITPDNIKKVSLTINDKDWLNEINSETLYLKET